MTDTRIDPIDGLIDHGASLQRAVDQLAREIMLLTLASLMLALAVALLGARVWRSR
jgi:hypothetical protein